MAYTQYDDRDDLTVPMLSARLGQFRDEIMLEAIATAKAIGEMLVEYARANHPWQNRTGDTEASTEAIDGYDATGAFVTISVGTPYAIYLEENETWAWLWPAMLANQENIARMWQEGLSDGSTPILSSAGAIGGQNPHSHAHKEHRNHDIHHR